MNVPRSAQKAIRDFIVMAVGTLLLALAERAGDFGVPPEAIPAVSAGALLLYRMGRGALGRDPTS